MWLIKTDTEQSRSSETQQHWKAYHKNCHTTEKHNTSRTKLILCFVQTITNLFFQKAGLINIYQVLRIVHAQQGMQWNTIKPPGHERRESVVGVHT